MDKQLKTPTQPSNNATQQKVSRRRLLKLFTGLAASSFLLGRAQAAPQVRPQLKRSLTILESRIAGFAHYQGQACIKSMKPGDALTLKREPNNSHDKKAIEVYWRNQKIGYVAKVNNKAISKLLDSGEAVDARLKYVNIEQDYEPLWFKVNLWV